MPTTETREPGYDALNDRSATFESLKGAEVMKQALEQMYAAAQEAGAVKSFQRQVETVENDFDRNGIDPENGNQGVIVERRVPVVTPKFESSSWRTYVDADRQAFYGWRIGKPANNPDAAPMLTLETPWGIPMGDFKIPLNGVPYVGRRVQEYVTGEDGKIHGRSADYTIVGRPTDESAYRIYPHSQKEWEASTTEVEFLVSQLAQAELVQQNQAEDAQVRATAVAPNLPDALSS